MRIKLPVGETVYLLEFTKKSIVAMERGGFSLRKVEEAPHIYLPMFIQGSFKANHPSLPNAKIDEIWEHVENKDGLLEVLLQMYQEQADALMEEPKENDPKKVVWEVA